MNRIIFILIFLTCFSHASADDSYFIDVAKILNTSKAGAEAQKKLKNKYQSETKKFRKIEDDIKKEESSIISQKASLTKEEYKKKVENLRKKVSTFQKNKRNSFNSIAKTRQEVTKSLLISANPIIKKYMEENKIRVILDKNGIFMGDSNLEITDKIIVILNKELPSLKIN
jgi:Skp family chaperone for outer membrane proteins